MLEFQRNTSRPTMSLSKHSQYFNMFYYRSKGILYKDAHSDDQVNIEVIMGVGNEASLPPSAMEEN